jgi:16S rRNA (adenine1518-N6/adenine1519-N6)-dimethyltransferase
MKPTEIRAILERAGVRPSRALGQNFLHDVHHLARIVQAAGLHPADSLLEIGPGLGSLTELLLARIPEGHLLAVEKDEQLGKTLLERFGPTTRFELVLADALEWIRQTPRDWSGWTLVANLPYSVASRLLVELAQQSNPPDVWVVTLQLEVVQRIVAGPGSRDYGVLTLLIQARYAPDAWFRIPPGCFFPVPAVDSACIRLTRRGRSLLRNAAERETFERLVKRAFSQRRKMMPKLLYQDWPPKRIDELLASVGVDPKARAEQVTLEQYVAMTRALASRLPAAQPAPEQSETRVKESHG